MIPIKEQLRLDENLSKEILDQITDIVEREHIPNHTNLRVNMKDGRSVSMSQGKLNYCTVGQSVEVAVFDKEDDFDPQMIQEDHDQVKGHVSYGEAIRLIEKVARACLQGR